MALLLQARLSPCQVAVKFARMLQDLCGNQSRSGYGMGRVEALNMYLVERVLRQLGFYVVVFSENACNYVYGQGRAIG